MIGKYVARRTAIAAAAIAIASLLPGSIVGSSAGGRAGRQTTTLQQFGIVCNNIDLHGSTLERHWQAGR
jgi:hypothetical protein